MTAPSVSTVAKLFKVFEKFDGVDSDFTGDFDFKEEFIISKPVLICERCGSQVVGKFCTDCTKMSIYSNKKINTTTHHLDATKFGNSLGKILSASSFFSNNFEVNQTENGLWLVSDFNSNLRIGIFVAKYGYIHVDDFRKLASEAYNEKKCSFLLILAKDFDDNITKVMNYYPNVKISRFLEAAEDQNLFQHIKDFFSYLQPLYKKNYEVLGIHENNPESLIKNCQTLYDEITKRGTSSKELGNRFEDAICSLLSYLFTTYRIKDRNNLPELLIFDYHGGFYITDVKSGKYTITELREVKSYTETYTKIELGDGSQLDIKGLVIPHISWGKKADAINKKIERFSANYAPFSGKKISASLLDIDAILFLALEKQKMTNNEYSIFLLNCSDFFRPGKVPLSDVKSLLENIRSRAKSSSDSIISSLRKSRNIDM